MTNDEIRKNDEVRMPKRLICPPGAFRHSDFGFLLSFVIRHSSLATLAAPLVLTLLVSCSKPAASGVNLEADDALSVWWPGLKSSPWSKRCTSGTRATP